MFRKEKRQLKETYNLLLEVKYITKLQARFHSTMYATINTIHYKDLYLRQCPHCSLLIITPVQPRTRCSVVTKYISFLLPTIISPLLSSSYSLLTVWTVKSGRKMHCPQVSQATWTISDIVLKYFFNTEQSPKRNCPCT